MRKSIQRTILIAAQVAAMTAAVPAFASENTRATSPNVFGAELGGRGLFFSGFYDRMLDDDLAAGFGLGATATQQQDTGLDANQNANLLTAYANYYFTETQGSLYATAGATGVLNSGSVSGTKSTAGGLNLNNSVLPMFGIGYENRSEMGFLFRVTGYVLISTNVKPWAGLSFGYAF